MNNEERLTEWLRSRYDEKELRQFSRMFGAMRPQVPVQEDSHAGKLLQSIEGAIQEAVTRTVRSDIEERVREDRGQ